MHYVIYDIHIYRLYICTHNCTICISDIVHDPLIGLRSRCILPVVSLEHPFDIVQTFQEEQPWWYTKIDVLLWKNPSING